MQEDSNKKETERDREREREIKSSNPEIDYSAKGRLCDLYTASNGALMKPVAIDQSLAGGSRIIKLRLTTIKLDHYHDLWEGNT